MKNKNLLFGASLVASLLSFFSARESLACSMGCYEGDFLPSKRDVPASMPGIFWNTRLGGQIAAPWDVTLSLITPMGNVPVPFTAMQFNNEVHQLILVPDEPLLPNSDYELRDSISCTGSTPPLETTFHTTDVLPFPKTLGSLIVVPASLSALDLSSGEGGCSSQIMALQSRIELVPSIEALPFAHAFYYETVVDGKLWKPLHAITQIVPPGGSWEGRGEDLLYTTCGFEPPSGVGNPLAEGDHTVVFRASLLGSDFVIESEPATVSLKCPEVTAPPKVIIESPGCQSSATRFGGSYRGWMTISFAMAALMACRRRNSRDSSNR